MHWKSFFISCLGVAVLISVMEYVIHEILLSGWYEATASLWRPKAEQWDMVAWMFGGMVLFVGVFGYIYVQGRKGKSLTEGMRYGGLIGLLIGSIWLMFYAIQPIPLTLIGWWIIAGLVEMATAGAVFAYLYRPKEDVPVT